MEPRHVDALLIGGGVAAARCARTLRRSGFSGSITLVGEEPVPPYNRPPLSKELLREELPQDLLLAEPASWYGRRDVELALGSAAVRLDAAARLVELSDGRRLRFDQCLLATGAEPRRPEGPSSDVAHVLRTVADAESIRSRAAAGRTAVVLGGGFIGVEVAASLASRGVSVTLQASSGLPLAGFLGRHVGEWAAAALREAGVELRLGTPHEAGVPDLVVAGIGVVPRTRLALEAGLEVDDGIVVDDAQRTGAPGIFAAGDVARPRDGERVEHWHAARESGERAALAMLGRPVPPIPAAWIFSEFAGHKLDVVGLPRGAEQVVAPGIVGFGHGASLAAVAILDSACDVTAARSLVERGAPFDELALLAAA